MGPILVVGAWAEFHLKLYPGRRPHAVGTFEEATAWLSWVPHFQEVCLIEQMLERRSSWELVQWLARAQLAGEAPRIDQVSVMHTNRASLTKRCIVLVAAGFKVRSCQIEAPREWDAALMVALFESGAWQAAQRTPELIEFEPIRWHVWTV